MNIVRNRNKTKRYDLSMSHNCLTISNDDKIRMFINFLLSMHTRYIKFKS